MGQLCFFFFSSRRRHTRWTGDWSSDVCSSDLTGLPPVRLHDLRHGAASLALAAGADLKVIADQLGHCSIVLTADTYISVATELGLAAAEAVARLILRAGKRPPGGTMPRRADAQPLAVIAA